MSYDPSYTYQNQSQEYFSEEQYYYYYAQDYVNTENTSFEKNDTNSDLTLAYPYEEYNFAHPSDTYNVHNISQHSNSVSVRHPNVSRATSYDSFEYSQGLRTTDSRAGSPQSQAKCRQLPCRTFISTGSCPYGDRCVFLHDPTIEAKPALLKHKRKSKEDSTVDAFFWPTMTRQAVNGKIDDSYRPHISQPYVVPPPNSNSVFANSINDTAVYSIWEHFLDFCVTDINSVVTVPRIVPPLDPYNTINIHTGKKRLPIFIQLSQNNDE